MKRIYIPLIALGIGFANAFLAFHVQSLFFCLLPLLAFTFGYFSSSKKGSLIGLPALRWLHNNNIFSG
jgi:hypothetical protein